MISTNSSLWHYTSFEVLTYVLGKDNLNNKELCFWFSNPLQTNDKKEVRFFEEKVYKGNSGKDLQSECEKIKDRIGSPFTLSLIHHQTSKKTYRPCEIPMWRMYGDNFKGVRLGFKYGKLKKFCETKGLSLSKCKYLTKSEMEKKAQDIRKNFQSQLLSCEQIEATYMDAVCYKTYDWIHENEWRIINWTNDINKIEYRSKDGRLYVPIRIPLSLLEVIEVGPKADYKAIEGSLYLIKEKLGDIEENHFKINPSKLEIGYT